MRAINKKLEKSKMKTIKIKRFLSPHFLRVDSRV